MVKRLSKEAKTMAMAAALIAQYGGDTKVVTEAEPPLHNWRNDDAVVELAKTPTRFVMRRCRNCKRTFGHNKPIPVGELVGLCSDDCRREDWKKTTGLDYKVITTRDVWEGDPPMIITPDQIEKLRALKDWFIQNETLLQERATEPAPLPSVYSQAETPTQIDQESVDRIQAEMFAAESSDESAFLDQDDTQTIPDFSLDYADPLEIDEEVAAFEF